MSTRPYVVRQGDYTGRLAARFGVDAEALWGHARNRALGEARSDREVLAPGDILHVPEAPEASARVSPHQSNRYRARIATTPLSLVIRDGQRPLPNERCAVHGMGRDPVEMSTDGEGRLRLQVPTHVQEITIVVIARRLSCPVRIGHLDPASDWSGIRQRLVHLGYLARLGVTEGHQASDEVVRRALRLFQGDQGLTVNGEHDEATRARLVQVHGS
jgi:N-acetylmuramoyl-L-alanine amidase